MIVETLAATLPRDVRFHVGEHTRTVPAGSVVVVALEDIEAGRTVVKARLASNPRINGYVYASALIPA